MFTACMTHNIKSCQGIVLTGNNQRIPPEENWVNDTVCLRLELGTEHYVSCEVFILPTLPLALCRENLTLNSRANPSLTLMRRKYSRRVTRLSNLEVKWECCKQILSVQGLSVETNSEETSVFHSTSWKVYGKNIIIP